MTILRNFKITLWLMPVIVSLIPGFGAAQGKRPTDLNDMSLKELAPLPIGVAIGYSPMQHNKVYAGIVTGQFDQITFENALKNGSVVQPDGQFNYTRADELLKICRADSLKVYGHTLCWYQQNSPFLYTLHGDSAAIEYFLKKYITQTVSHYKNTIHAWDVVNEAIDSLGRLRTGGIKKKGYFYWGRYLKKGYIARAFKYAHAADPQALLFYNDYNLEIYPAKLKGVVDLLLGLKQEGVPVSGVGTQMHININTPDKGIDHAFRALASTGLLVRISELDIKVNPANNPGFVLTREIEKKQAEKCRYVLQSFFKYVPARQRYGITFWNVGEQDSWITKDSHWKGSPTLFDKNYKPKLMYFTVLDFFKKMKTVKVD